MANASWFKRGTEGVEEGKKIDDESARQRAEARDDNVIAKKKRLWLPPNTSVNFTFLDTEGFFLREHQLFLGGSWINFESCLSDFDNCPLCDSGKKPSYVVVFTGIDHSEYILKRGPNAGMRIKNSKRLAVFKTTARVKILKQKERRDGNLTGCTLEITRFTDKDNSSGSDFEFVKRCTTEELMAFAPKQALGKNGLEDVNPEEWIKPFDYMNVFKPKTAAELTSILGGTPPEGSEDTNNQAGLPSDKEDIGKFL